LREAQELKKGFHNTEVMKKNEGTNEKIRK
jgi:hypothetical protein